MVCCGQLVIGFALWFQEIPVERLAGIAMDQGVVIGPLRSCRAAYD